MTYRLRRRRARSSDPKQLKRRARAVRFLGGASRNFSSEQEEVDVEGVGLSGMVAAAKMRSEGEWWRLSIRTPFFSEMAVAGVGVERLEMGVWRVLVVRGGRRARGDLGRPIGEGGGRLVMVVRICRYMQL
jgi:hypothetical protein